MGSGAVMTPASSETVPRSRGLAGCKRCWPARELQKAEISCHRYKLSDLLKGQFLYSIQNKETEAIPEFNEIPPMSSKVSNNVSENNSATHSAFPLCT